MILLGLLLAFVMPFSLRVELLLQLQLQHFMVLIQGRHSSSVKVYYLVGGCVAYTLVWFVSHCRRSIISR